MRKTLSRVVRLAVFGACVVYAFWGMDVGALRTSLSGYDTQAIVWATLVSLLAYVCLGVRLHFMMHERPGIRACTAASLLALGVNNLLPAKLGEVAKVVYLQRVTGAPALRLLAVVFWERFADVNAILLAALVTLWLLHVHAVLVLPLAVVAAAWLVLLAVMRWPQRAAAVIALVPVARLRDLLLDIKGHVRTGTRGGTTGLVLGTPLVWSCYAASSLMMMLWAAGLPLGLPQALAVFAVAALGMSVPAAPGGLGVFEAAMVASLGWFGIARSDALAIALVTHLVQYVPTTSAAAVLMARARLRADRIDAVLREKAPLEKGADGAG